MKIKLVTLFLSLLPLLTFAQNLTSFRLDPDNARGGKTGDLFSEVKFIPLETTQESLFGNISKMEVSKDFFIIYDSNTGEIFIFKKTGKFRSRIRQRKASEYIGDFSINDPGKEIYVWVGEKILVYDFNAKFIREEMVVKDGAHFHFFTKENILFSLNRNLDYTKNQETGHDIIYSSGLGDIKNKYLSYNKKYSKYDYNIPYTILNTQSDGSVIYTFPYDYTLSRFDPNGLKEQFKFIFPQKYSLPLGFTNDSSFVNKRKDYVFGSHLENRDKITGLTPFFKIKDCFIFHCEKIGTNFTYTDNLLYSIKTSALYTLDRVNGDQLSYFIPVLDSHFSERLHAASSESIFTSIPAQILLQVKTNSPTSVKYSPELDSFFRKNSKGDNPVIIEATLKSSL